MTQCTFNDVTPLFECTSTDGPDANDGKVAFKRTISVREDDDDSLNLSVTAIPVRRRHQRHESGAGICLNAAEARVLRDRLDKWLSTKGSTTRN